ncbi:hypothetical protein FJV46_10395 [Arthrobacter agilis]|uniref:hypothetical protein n=1 Tax=Arthrobacter agilis TaxID=37921 RepID=UPI000B356A62|nr:hypothetical protein [Arthrobacter agilis]OUM44210.1 hypothetical protein B8W74_04885 [Arthrobacter agilis]PPB46584.1 hypothetical protein CI784_07175 [Arthrobacter agilis]TPV23757.1 hypothetical protein FJV46_10395 [Arthrobacter agilis]VDR32487.1 Uncharacterised protein [Arthrobacter agilis]
MNEILSFAGNYWWLIFPLSGVFAMWGSSWSEASERRHRRKVELYRLKHPALDAVPGKGATAVDGEARKPARERDLRHIERMHDEVDGKWLTYELDASKLIDYPTMTDVREPLTVAFLRAKREADALRPQDREGASAEDLAAYRSAVTTYDVAFQVAETEARRVRAGGFTPEERRRLATARTLVTVAVDEAATEAERQTAYRRARRELDGLIVLPDATVAALEKTVAGALGSRPEPTAS